MSKIGDRQLRVLQKCDEANRRMQKKEYHVVWEIEVSADNPREAALKAQEFQRDRNSTANVFDVSAGKEIIHIDLDE